MGSGAAEAGKISPAKIGAPGGCAIRHPTSERVKDGKASTDACTRTASSRSGCSPPRVTVENVRINVCSRGIGSMTRSSPSPQKKRHTWVTSCVGARQSVSMPVEARATQPLSMSPPKKGEETSTPRKAFRGFAYDRPQHENIAVARRHYPTQAEWRRAREVMVDGPRHHLQRHGRERKDASAQRWWHKDACSISSWTRLTDTICLRDRRRARLKRQGG